MIDFVESFKGELITTAIVLVVFGILNKVSDVIIKKIGRRINKNEARTKLISRYFTVTLILIVIAIEALIFGARWSDIGVLVSSVFAVIGIALFATWSILSNVTSGVIMFFSFPYKVGDKIEIHDKDFPVRAIIEDIGTFHLHLRLESGDFVTYPNNLILQKAVTLLEKNAIETLIEDDD